MRSLSLEIVCQPAIRWWLKLGVVIVLLQVALIFVVIPGLSDRLKTFYNEDQVADGYDLLAHNLIAGDGYRFYRDTARTLMREPGYPVFLAGLQSLFGPSMRVVKIANMILALATAGLTILIVRRFVPGAGAFRSSLILAAPLLYLFNPGTLIAECRGGVEILFGLLGTLFVFTIFRCIQSGRLWDYVVSGAVLGLLVLVRSTPMLFPVFLLFYLLSWRERQLSTQFIVRNVAALILTMLAVMSPWITRNYRLTGKFVPTASVVGVSAQAGQYINTHLFEGRPWWLLDREASRERDRIAARLGLPFEDGAEGYYQTFYKSTDELNFSNYLVTEVVNEYKKSPVLLLRCLAQNAFSFWFAGKTPMSTAGDIAVQVPYLALAGIGFAYCLRNRQTRLVAPLVLYIVYIWAVHVPILAQARYSVPLIPLLSCLGTYGLIAMQQRTAAASTISRSCAVNIQQ